MGNKSSNAIRQLTSKDSSVTFNPVDGEAPVVDLSASGGAGGSLTLTDGTNTVNDVTQIAVSGATVGGSTPDATLTIPAGNSTQVIGVNSFPYTISSGAGLTQISVYAGSSAVTVNLPATPAVNQMVRVVDAGNTAATGTITINGNGQTISAYGGTQSSIEIASNGGDIWLGWDTEGEQWS